MSAQVNFGIGVNCATCCGAAPCTCGAGKQIIGTKLLVGTVSSFAHPGFKANYESGWTLSVTNGSFSYTCTGTIGYVFNPGDLVVGLAQSARTLTDYLSGLTYSYPKTYIVYICTSTCQGANASGANYSGDPSTSGYFTVYNYNEQDHLPGYNYIGGKWYGVGGWETFGILTDSTLLGINADVTITDYPLYASNAAIVPAGDWAGYNMSAIGTLGPYGSTPPGYYNGNAGGYPQCENIAGDIYSQTVWNQVTVGGMTFPPDGSAVATGGGGSIISDGVRMDWLPHYLKVYPAFVNYGGLLVAALTVAAPEAPQLVQWIISTTCISYTFAIWTATTGNDFSFMPGCSSSANIATAVATIRQTVTIFGDSYTTTQVSEQATALMNSVSFASVDCASGTTYTYNADGSIAANPTQTAYPDLTQVSYYVSCTTGGALPYSSCFNALSGSNQSIGKCQVTPCSGTFCYRLYNCPTVTCITETASGSSYTLDPFALSGLLTTALTPGQGAAIYQTVSGSTGSCSCT